MLFTKRMIRVHRHKLIQNLRKGNGVRLAVKNSDVSWPTYCKWLRIMPRFARIVDHVRTINDTKDLELVQDTLMTSITYDRSVPAIKYYLNNRAPNRWKEKQDNELASQKIIVIHSIPDKAPEVIEEPTLKLIEHTELPRAAEDI